MQVCVATGGWQRWADKGSFCVAKRIGRIALGHISANGLV